MYGTRANSLAARTTKLNLSILQFILILSAI
nr:MAG TPA: hypothetical protein [Caudoviricetes sp.]